MNKLAKKMANREGFTLVELIVVIAILGILAGIAIPVYSGYIAKAKEAAVIQQMDAIKTATVFVLTEDSIASDSTVNVTSMTVKDGYILAGSTTLTDEQLVEVADFCGLGDEFKVDWNGTGKDTATLANGQWTLTKAATSGEGG